MVSYKTLIKEYRREFSTVKDARKYLPERWLILIAVLFLANLILAVYASYERSIILYCVYLVSIIATTWFAHRKIASKNYDRVKKYNKKKFTQFILKTVGNSEKEYNDIIRDLLLISHYNLSRQKPSIRVYNGLIILIISPLLGYVPNIINISDLNPMVIALLAIIIAMIVGIILMIKPITDYLLDRGYHKEQEFRLKLENYLLNYNKEDWDI